jgi:hypothetical protein
MRKQLGLLALLSVACLVTRVAAAPQTPSASNLTVHEWGTFTSVAGQDGRAVEWTPLSGPSDLPCFVTFLNPNSPKISPGGSLPQMKATVRMETPVVYFYAPEETTVRVAVSFPKGVVSEWYPQASVPPSFPWTKLSETTGAIQWQDVKVLPHAKPAFLTEDGLSHYYAARETDAAPIAVGGQMEKFLFYRGLASFPVPLTASLDEHGAVVVSNTSAYTMPAAILFENQNGRMGYSVVNDLKDTTTIPRPALTKNFDALRRDLQTTLVARGLYEREAAAMIETWRDSWFDEGTRVFYVFPQEAVNEILPLQISPTPKQTARVFVGRIEIFTPTVQNDVERAIRHNDLPALTKYGRFLEPIAMTIVPRFAQNEQGQITSALRAVAAWYSAVAAEHACK